jgi:cytochrome c556
MMLTRWLLTAALFVAAPALAQTSAPSDSTRREPTVASVMDACQADLRTVCGEEPFEASRLSQCIQRNKDKVSPACQAVWPSATGPQQARPTDRRSDRREARQACAADLRSFCDGKRGRERRDCVRDNQDKFSSACRDAMRDLRSARQAQRRGGNQQDDDDDEF